MFKLSGQWLAGDHVFSAGYEREELHRVQHFRAALERWRVGLLG